MHVAPTFLIYVMSAAIAVGLILDAWQQRANSSTWPFRLLMAAVVFWTICHIISITRITLAAALIWAQIRTGGTVLFGPLWLLCAYTTVGQRRPLRAGHYAALLLPALLAYAAALTNGWHLLWWRIAVRDTSDTLGLLQIAYGPLFQVYALYNSACLLAGCALFFWAAYRATPPGHTTAWLEALGACMPLLGKLAELLGMRTSVAEEIMPLLLTSAGLIISYARLYSPLSSLLPIAQREILAGMAEGVVLLDHSAQVVAINNMAPQLLGSARTEWVGQPIAHALSGATLERDLCAMLPAQHTASREISHTQPEGLHVVEVQVRPIYSARVFLGTLIMLYDRSARARIAAELDQRLHELTIINRLARAANSAHQTETLIHTLFDEMLASLPGDRVMLGLIQPETQQLRLVLDQLRDPADARRPAGGEPLSFGQIGQLFRAHGTRLLQASDPQLAGTPALALLQREQLRALLLVPLYSQAALIGALIIGYHSEQIPTLQQQRLFETVGELVTETVVRTQLYEQAQEVNRTKSELLATVSHELRSPLTSISGFTDMLTSGRFGELPQRTLEPLRHISNNSQKLLQMINELLDFSKMEAGRLKIELYPVDLPSVIHSVANVMEPQLQERGLALKLNIAQGLPLAYANTERVEQVLTNLISNAIKFTDSGSITVSVANSNARLRLSVADTGIGIPPEQQRLIFQDFHQIANPANRRYRGTGLGLSITRRLVEMMGGSISVESWPGLGSTFFCDLPLAEPQLLQNSPNEREAQL